MSSYDIPSAGWTQRFPAVSSLEVFGKASFTYLLSSSSSFLVAHGNVALNLNYLHQQLIHDSATIRNQHSSRANKSIITTSHQEVRFGGLHPKEFRLGDNRKRCSQVNVGKEPEFISSVRFSAPQIRLPKPPEVNKFLDLCKLECQQLFPNAT